MEHLTDESIWHRMLDGDARAFGLIWDRHRDRVFHKLLTLGSQPADAEDLTAVAFLELWRRRRSVRFVDGSLRPWLLVTSGNVWRNSSRSMRRSEALLARLPHPDNAPDPSETVAERGSGRTRLAREVLLSAREADRQLAVLTAVDGLSVREAAEALGISESAAKMRLSRLRKRLTETIGSPLFEGEH